MEGATTTTEAHLSAIHQSLLQISATLGRMLTYGCVNATSSPDAVVPAKCSTVGLNPKIGAVEGVDSSQQSGIVSTVNPGLVGAPPSSTMQRFGILKSGKHTPTTCSTGVLDDQLTHIGGLSLFLELDLDSANKVFEDDVFTTVGGISLFLDLTMDFEVLTCVGDCSIFLQPSIPACHENTFSFAMVDVSAEGSVCEVSPSWHCDEFSQGVTNAKSEYFLHCSAREHLSVLWNLDGLQHIRCGTSNCKVTYVATYQWDPGISHCHLPNSLHMLDPETISSCFCQPDFSCDSLHTTEILVRLELLRDAGGSWFACLVLNSELIAGHTTGCSMHNLILDSIAWLGDQGLVAALGGIWETTNNGVTYSSGAIQLSLFLKLELHATLNMDSLQTGNQMGLSAVYQFWPLGSSNNEKSDMSWHRQVQEEPCKCRNLFSFFAVSSGHVYVSSGHEYKQWDPGIGQKD